MIFPDPDDLIFFENIAKGCGAMANIANLQYEYNQRELVYQYDKIKIYHYRAKHKKIHSPPLLIVFATVNRPEILDLFPEHSFIGGLLAKGLDVYLLDWGYPDQQDQHITLDHYIVNYLRHGIQFILESSKNEHINLLGVCQGGLMCLCYSILFPHIKNLILISTPIDFQTKDNVIGNMFRQFNVDEFIELMGNIPGLWLTNFFISLRPFELVGKKYLRFVDHIDEKDSTQHFLRVEKWLYDAPDQTAASFKALIKDFYQQNKLIKGELYLDHQRIDLRHLNIPVLNIMASEDEIIPVSATRVLKNYISSEDYTQKIFPSGHIGIYISAKVGKALPAAIAKWLKARP